MKKIFYMLTAALALAAFSACEDGEGDVISFGNKELKVVDANLLFGPQGGTNTITVESLNPVSATSGSSWAAVAVSGSSVSVTVPAWSSNESRYAKITLKAGAETCDLTVQQSGVQVKEFNPSDISAASKPCQYDFPFVSNAEMTATADVDWITPSIIKGVETHVDTLRIALTANETVDPRSGVVSYAAGSYTGTINVSQAGAMVTNDNWTITYEGVTKVDGKSKDDLLVTVGEEDTGKYSFAVVPASEYEASGLPLDDFIVTTIAPEIVGDERFNETHHFYFPKFDNGKYIAFAVGFNDQNLTSGWYQTLEFTIDREKTPYEKWLGTWTVPRGDGNTDEWIISEIEEDASVKIQGICGATPEWMANDKGATATFDPATGKLSIMSGQVIDEWEDGTYGALKFTLQATILYNGNVSRVGGSFPIGEIELKSDTSAEMNGLTVTLSGGTEFAIRGMRYFGIVSAGGLSYSVITEQVFPAKLTRKGSGTSSVKPKSVRIPYRLAETPVAAVAAVSAR